MKKVETFGLYHYEVVGERENEAAEELDNRYTAIIMDSYNPYAEDDIVDLRRDIEQKFGVVVNVIPG